MSNKDMVISQDRPTFLSTVQPGAVSRGNEGVTVSDIVIPRLEIVQDLSPARKKDKPEYIKGAEEGMIFNTVTRQLFGTSVLLVPVLFRKEYLIWKDRNHGGGFKGAFPDEMAAKVALAALDPQERGVCQIKDTGQHFCLLLDRESGKIQEVVVSMSSTKLKVSRNWNSLVRLTDEDRFARAYILETVAESNAKGSYYNWKVTQVGYPPEAAYRAAEKMYEAVKAGRIIEADRSVDGTEEASATAAASSEI